MPLWKKKQQERLDANKSSCFKCFKSKSGVKLPPTPLKDKNANGGLAWEIGNVVEPMAEETAGYDE